MGAPEVPAGPEDATTANATRQGRSDKFIDGPEAAADLLAYWQSEAPSEAGGEE